MAKFKKGDRLIALGDVAGQDFKGKKCTLISDEPADSLYQYHLQFDEDGSYLYTYGKYKRSRYSSFGDEFELIENTITNADLMRARDALLRNRVGTACTFTAGEINLTETKPKKTIMKKLNTLVKKLLDSKTQTLLKAGLINGDLERTSTGTDALLDILFLEKMDALVTVAEEHIAEEEKGNN